MILVTGATGQQGRSVAEALLARGRDIRVMVRKENDERVQPFVNAGAEVVVADFDDSASLVRAMEGVDALFLVTTPFGGGAAAETEHGKRAIDAAATAGVKYIVYSSVSDADRNTGIGHFDSKYEVEKHLAASGIRHAITAPTFFYENLFFGKEQIEQGTFHQALPSDRKLQMVSVRDIGRFNALALDRADDFAGKRINYAGAEVSGAEVAAILGVKYEQQPLEQLAVMGEDFVDMYRWFDDTGYSVDIPSLHKEYAAVEWLSFEDWARQAFPAG